MNYHVARNGQQLGSLPESEIRSRLSRGDLSPNDLCWAEGMTDWQPLGSTLTPLDSEAVTPPAYNPTAPAPAYNPYAAPQADLSLPTQPGARGELAGLGQRLGAAIVDGLIAGFCGAFLGIGGSMLDEAEINGGSETPGLIFMVIGGILLLVLAIYSIILLCTKGQTLGKKLLNIRIVTYQGDENPGFVRLILLRFIVNAFLGFIPLYGLIDILVIFGQERRCIHDVIAGTKVVKC